MSMSLHLVEKSSHPAKAVGAVGEWESGNWAVSPVIAKRLTEGAGNLYLHSARSEPSHWGGTIVGYRIIEVGKEGKKSSRVVFRFLPSITHKNVVTDTEGWGQERKYVGVEEPRATRAKKAAAEVLGD